MKIALQSFGLVLLGIYVYSAYWVTRDAFDPIPEFPHRRDFLGPARAGAFFLGTGGLVAWGVESLIEGSSGLAALVGFAAASGAVYLFMELKRRGLAEMEWQADADSREVLDGWRSLRKEEITKHAQELEAELLVLRRKLPLEGAVGRQLSRREWIALWRNEATLAGFTKLHAREAQQSIAGDRPQAAGP